MKRAKWKGPIPNRQLDIIKDKKNVAVEFNRCAEITLVDVGLSIKIHNGKGFVKLNITADMVGHKGGELAPTRERAVFKKKK